MSKDGYTKIPDKYLEEKAKLRIPGEAAQVLTVIERKIFGWDKDIDWISLSQFYEITGIKKPNIKRAIKKLMEMGVIQKDNKLRPTYQIVLDFRKWKPLSKKITVIQKDNGVIQKDNTALSKKIPTKDTVTKDTKTKNNIKYKEVDVVILYLNNIGSRNFSCNKANRRNINARLKEGYTVEDCKSVIDYKFETQWMKDNPEHFNPVTLFRDSNFEKNLAGAKNTPKNVGDEWLKKRLAERGK